MNNHLSSWQLAALAVTLGAVIANAYYIHPIISRVAADFAVSPSAIGLVPAMNQIALALGILLILPLGDRINNTRLATLSLGVQCVALAVMAGVDRFEWFVVASAVMGFSMILPYLTPAWVSKRVDPSQLGHVTATLTTGVLAGILLSRTVAGVIGEFLHWRWIYGLAATVMLAVMIIIPRVMGREDEVHRETALGYPALLGSAFRYAAHAPDVLISGVIQGLGFAMFLCVWLGLGLHLTSPAMGYGLDTVGYLALLGAFSLFTTPPLGRLADRVGPTRSRVVFALIQFGGVFALSLSGHSLWLMVLPLLIMNVFGPLVDVTGRMIILSKAPDIRTRLMTIYITLMFVGGGIGSWVGPAVYESGGWQACAYAALGFSGASTALSALALALHRQTGKHQPANGTSQSLTDKAQ